MAQYFLFLDANVFLDAILYRNAEKACQKILNWGEKETKVKLYTSPSCLLTTIYFLHKSKMPPKTLRETILKLVKFISLQPATVHDFSLAMNSNFSDLEDAVQYQAASQIKGIHYFVTSNLKDFKKAKEIPVILPADFVEMIEINKKND